jgi:hypothetical protein
MPSPTIAPDGANVPAITREGTVGLERHSGGEPKESVPSRPMSAPAHRRIAVFILLATMTAVYGVLARITGHSTIKLALVGVVVSALLMAVQVRWRTLMPSARAVKALLLVALVGPGITILFLLPPFQGPDEIQHWKTALLLSRRDAMREVPLYSLSEIVDAWRVVQKPANKVDPFVLRTEIGAREPDTREVRVTYASVASYPAVSLVAMIFPRVEDIREALVFYYLCRLLPLALLLGLLWLLNRHDDLPYLAWFFFSLPLVLQQSSVISTDTVTNLGTLAAAAVFVHLRRRPGPKMMALLVGLCLVVAGTKPVAAAVVLLPLSLVPWRSIPARRIVAGGLTLVAAGLLLVMGKTAIDMIHESGGYLGPASVDGQLQFLGTLGGLATFVGIYGGLMWSLGDVSAWAHPLGWLDTNLSSAHLRLIAASGLIALFLDAGRAIRAWPGLLRDRKGELAWVVGVVVAHFAFLSLSMCAILYVAWSPPHADSIWGFQVRYLFPSAILALVLPGVLKNVEPTSEDRLRSSGDPGLFEWASNTLAMVLLPLMLFARQIELVVDLLTRFW